MTAINSFLYRPVSLAPLAFYRIGFGALMLFSTLRFMANGWVDSLLVQPEFHFRYLGFEWVPIPGETGMYLLFGILILSALGIMLGLFYRISTVLFFLSFTWVELIDKSYYLNHYYFVSLVAFLLIFLPAHRNYSLDARFGRVSTSLTAPAWTRYLLMFQISVVYFFAAVAKMEPQWLTEAMPLKIWLHSAHHWPVVGDWFKTDTAAYVFSWCGMLYDLLIPFALIYRKTRPYAFVSVVIFHVLTWMLFPIGVFPWVMIFGSTIFASESFHEKILNRFKVSAQAQTIYKAIPAVSIALGLFAIFQITTPLRNHFYDGHVFWHESGYRFSWRVMLMEKAATAEFTVKDRKTGRTIEIDNSSYLTMIQERQMSTQPDMILEFAHFLHDQFDGYTVHDPAHGDIVFEDPEVLAQVDVRLNDHGPLSYVRPDHDLSSIPVDLSDRTWLEPAPEFLSAR